MGSTRSPAAPLDPPPYTHAAKHRSAPKSSPEDNDHDHNHGVSDRNRKKKKKSRKERHGLSHLHHSHQHDGEDEDQDMEESTTTPPPPIVKLPPIKISLRLPANPAIIPQSSSSSSNSARNASSSNGSSKKKRRSSEVVSVVSEEEDGDRPQFEYPDEDHQEPQRRKKKHKHKHRHRHPKHEQTDDNTTTQGRLEQGLTSDWPLDSNNHHSEDDHGAKETFDPTAAKIAVKLETKEKARGEKKLLSSSSSRRQHAEDSPEIEPRSASKSRSRSLSQHLQSVSTHIKSEEPLTQQPYQNDRTSSVHSEIGQKRPFSALQSQRSQSADTDLDEGHTDDPLIGELDEPEEDEDDLEEDEDEDDAAELSDDDDLRSPTSVSAARAPFGSKSVSSVHTGSKTVPSASAGAKHTAETSMSKDVTASEGSASGPTKSARRGKNSRRVLTPKPTTPAIPKKKELSVVCHKLLDHFIRRDSYVLFSQPVDIIAVPDYPTVIKNPMDLSTMRAKVERNFYPNIDEFLKDFQLVCDNARLYNSKETLYWKQADKLWEWGFKAIDRERKTILEKDEEVLRTVKDEETLDIGGMGDYSNNNSSSSTHGFASRGQLTSADGAIDSPMAFGDSGRAHTPQQYRKSKKIKQRRDGTIALSYATDGSIDPASHPDPWSLVPVGLDFGSTPQLCILNNSSTYYNGAYLDEYPYRKTSITTYRSANYLDYGPYATLKDPAVDASASGVQNIPAYTGMVFGDEKGEAYVRSLAMFLDGIVDQSELAQMSEDDSAGLLEVQEFIRSKVETLTRGASTIVDKVAAVVREETTGKAMGMDTRVPKALWSQEVFEANAQDAESATEVEGESMELQTSQQMDDADMQDAHASVGEQSTPKTTSADDMVLEAAIDINTKTQKSSEPEMVDIREIVDEIKAWPALLSKRKDYEAWRQLKIELDNLLPANQRSAPASTDTQNSTADTVKILWGERWTGEDSEDSKIWVREYLEKNSEDMRQVLPLMARVKKNTVAAPASTVSSSAATSAGSSSASTTAPDSSSATDDRETQLLEKLVKSIRVRLAEMAKYVPLSEINPQRLPPPPPPALAKPASTPPAQSAESSPASSSASGNTTAPGSAAPPSTAAPSVSGSKPVSQTTSIATPSKTSATPAKIVTRATTASRAKEPAAKSPACSTPDGDSASSLSSPGSSP